MHQILTAGLKFLTLTYMYSSLASTFKHKIFLHIDELNMLLTY